MQTKPIKLRTWLHQLTKELVIMSMERPCTIPSSSEVQRWMAQGAIAINGETNHHKDEDVDFPIHSLVFFPKSKTRRITLL